MLCEISDLEVQNKSNLLFAFVFAAVFYTLLGMDPCVQLNIQTRQSTLSVISKC